MRNHLNQIGNWPERARAANYHAEPLARLCGVSTRTLQRFFASKKWGSAQHWLNELCLERAPSLLKDQGMSVKEAAAESGYTQPSHFSRKFKEFHGVSPSVSQKAYLARLSPPGTHLSPPGTYS